MAAPYVSIVAWGTATTVRRARGFRGTVAGWRSHLLRCTSAGVWVSGRRWWPRRWSARWREGCAGEELSRSRTRRQGRRGLRVGASGGTLAARRVQRMQPSRVVQLAERLTLDQESAGSNPAPRAMRERTHRRADHERSDGSAAGAIVLAAGEGSRMRSERPKPLHRLCGKPMLMYVLESLATCRSGVPRWWSATRASGSPRRCRSTPTVEVEFVEQRVQRGTGDATLVGLVGLPDEDDEGDVHRPDRRRTAAAVRDDRGAGRPPPQHRRRGDRAHRAHGRPHRLRPCRARARRPGHAHRRAARRDARGAGDPRDQHLDLLLPPEPARAGPASHRARQQPGRVLPDRRGRGARLRGPPRRQASSSGPPSRRQGVNDRLQLAAAEAELRARTNESLLRSG
jgi:bifunctional UDP-N-acetylglucosamine pyrophosphorylase/glucosamine-1-phosphate N-acetyltransferase